MEEPEDLINTHDQTTEKTMKEAQTTIVDLAQVEGQVSESIHLVMNPIINTVLQMMNTTKSVLTDITHVVETVLRDIRGVKVHMSAKGVIMHTQEIEEIHAVCNHLIATINAKQLPIDIRTVENLRDRNITNIDQMIEMTDIPTNA